MFNIGGTNLDETCLYHADINKRIQTLGQLKALQMLAEYDNFQPSMDLLQLYCIENKMNIKNYTDELLDELRSVLTTYWRRKEKAFYCRIMDKVVGAVRHRIAAPMIPGRIKDMLDDTTTKYKWARPEQDGYVNNNASRAEYEDMLRIIMTSPRVECQGTVDDTPITDKDLHRWFCNVECMVPELVMVILRVVCLPYKARMLTETPVFNNKESAPNEYLSNSNYIDKKVIKYGKGDVTMCCTQDVPTLISLTPQTVSVPFGKSKSVNDRYYRTIFEMFYV